MTADELRKFFNNTYGLGIRWPDRYEVDHETYANVCQNIFECSWDITEYWNKDGIRKIDVILGPNKGIMFRNVELILKGK